MMQSKKAALGAALALALSGSSAASAHSGASAGVRLSAHAAGLSQAALEDFAFAALWGDAPICQRYGSGLCHQPGSHRVQPGQFDRFRNAVYALAACTAKTNSCALRIWASIPKCAPGPGRFQQLIDLGPLQDKFGRPLPKRIPCTGSFHFYVAHELMTGSDYLHPKLQRVTVASRIDVKSTD